MLCIPYMCACAVCSMFILSIRIQKLILRTNSTPPLHLNKVMFDCSYSIYPLRFECTLNLFSFTNADCRNTRKKKRCNFDIYIDVIYDKNNNNNEKNIRINDTQLNRNRFKWHESSESAIKLSIYVFFSSFFSLSLSLPSSFIPKSNVIKRHCGCEWSVCARLCVSIYKLWVVHCKCLFGFRLTAFARAKKHTVHTWARRESSMQAKNQTEKKSVSNKMNELLCSLWSKQ